MKKSSIALLLTAILSVCSCVLFSPRTLSLKNNLPRETDVPGWLIERDPQNIIGADIVGLDSLLVKYGAVEYSDAVYREIADDPLLVTVEIIRLQDNLNAFGLFSMDRGFIEETEMDSMVQYKTRAGVFFLIRNHYIKLLVNRETSPDRLNGFMEIIRLNLKSEDVDTKYLPDYVNVIPGNILNSDLVYYCDGHEVINGGGASFVRRRVKGNAERYVLFYKTDSVETARAKYEKAASAGGFTLYKTKPLRLSILSSGSLQIAVANYRSWFLAYDRAESIREAENSLVNLVRDIKEFELIK